MKIVYCTCDTQRLCIPKYSNPTVCPRSLDLFYIVSSYINWVNSSWTDRLPNSQGQEKLKFHLVYWDSVGDLVPKVDKEDF